MSETLIEWLSAQPDDKVRRAVARLDDRIILGLRRDFANWAHAGQSAPPGDWSCWVMMGGRGFGKTRVGAEWIAAAVRAHAASGAAEPLRIALVAATLDEARRIMVEGDSGLLAVAADAVEDWLPTLRTLRFRGNAEATMFSGASPEALRGPQHHLAWCDELAKWERAADSWDMLQLGLRLAHPATGAPPRALVTTTPRSGPVLAAIMEEPGTVVTGGPTRANVHLSRAWQARIHARYAGTRLERQELHGEIITDGAGALWTVELLERCRCPSPFRGEGDSRAPARERGEGTGPVDRPSPSHPLRERVPPSPLTGEGLFTRTVIGVDPPSGDGTCGIVACAKDSSGIAHILADHSVSDCSPEAWARAVAAAASLHDAHRVVAERNQGGRMVESVLRAADARLPLKLVNATDNKAARAEPVALLFEAGKVRLAGRFPELEAELLALRRGGGFQPAPGAPRSPDRADAMVWALTELMLGIEKREPRVMRF